MKSNTEIFKRTFTVLLIALCTVQILSPVAFAQSATDSAMPQTATTSPTIQYELAYPGILPDNPLYSLKTLRDRVVSILISDPSKRTEFYLLNSDKRMSAGLMLLDKKNYTLAITTISKSNNYMNDAVQQFQKLAKNKRDVGLHGRLHTSIRKHHELVTNQIKIVPAAYRAPLQVEQKRLSEFENTMQRYQ